MSGISSHILLGTAILLCFLLAFRRIDGAWCPPATLFVLGFFSSTYLYAANILSYSTEFVGFAYENFSSALILTSGCFAALLAGYVVHAVLSRSRRVSTAPPLAPLLLPKSSQVIGILLLCLCAFVVFYTIHSGTLTSVRGENSYVSDSDVNWWYRLGFMASNTVGPLMLMLGIAALSLSARGRKRALVHIKLAATIVIALTVLLFNRQAAVVLILYLAILYHYRIKHFKKKQVLLVLLALVVLQVIRGFRNLRVPLAQITTSDLLFLLQEILSIDYLFSTVIGIFTGIAGWDVFTNVINIVPMREDYKYGWTYLSSLLGLLTPRALGLGSFAAVTPSVWYVDIYAPGTTNHGFDFSMLAEAYINFGSYMPMFFFFLGILVARLSKLILTTGSSVKLFCAVIVLVALTFGLRSDSNTLLKTCFYYTIPPLLLAGILNRFFKRTPREAASYSPRHHVTR